MRISGTILDRVFISLLPAALLAILILIIIIGGVNSGVVTIFLGLMVFWMLIDIVILVANKTKPMRIIDGSLYIGSEIIDPKSITKIKRVNPLKNAKWTIFFLSVSLKDGRTFQILDKPRLFFKELSSKKSITAKLLFEYFPELESRFSYS